MPVTGRRRWPSCAPPLPTGPRPWNAWAISTLPSVAHDGQRSYVVPPGETVRVEFTFENNGESYQAGVAVGYYVSTNNFISTGDRLIGTSSVSMGRADVFTRYDLVTIPLDLNVGQDYYLGVIVDYTGTVTETAEVNNQAYHAFRIACDTTSPESSMPMKVRMASIRTQVSQRRSAAS